MVWSDETIQHLRELWEQGHSTAEIGRRLAVSKNAIVGKAHRLDLTARPSPIRRDAADRLSDQSPAPLRMEGPTLPPLASARVQTAPWPARVQPLRSPPVVEADPLIRPTSESVTARPATPASVRVVLPVHAVQHHRSTPSCCWPIGEPGKKDFRFCDDASIPGKPYCQDHARLAYVKVRDRKEDAA
ncbi:GcrA family cell cycle regulator [Rhodopila sp.]|uniref:GcrA family cell cycle regulator n=1 Tax=Rhodopila sp. TaxID=2480087 RepID=UPI003D0AD4CB